ncbi:hypothetical protein I314_01032 [Cryptococcus bacillisporus CA1873]|uniref:Extracellular mutant protein 11 C-terminal domain-containing protein n=1 Tax=Cryptococcus bacillisporus CA1873 TaxID=1296111 RepID=A0ABR5BHF6_CRYGA|nr:hypothetical protein I314_01032 [Cryptococcus bacillisporus CA1873]|eukprot:KIR68611.1 hypothetical protein I314_01032 [Cryptococcus gattii CA1873]
MSRLAVTPINKATGLMRRHPSIRAPDRSSFGSIPEGVKVELHYLPPAAFIVDHSPPTCHSANTPPKPDRERARISPFPDEESFQTFENARTAVQDDDPFGGRHRKLPKSKGPSTTSPVTLGRNDFFGPWEPVKPQPSNHHFQDYRHSPASEPRDLQPLQTAKSFSIGNMPPPSDVIQQKGARSHLFNNSHINQQPVIQARSGGPCISQHGRGVPQAHPQITGPTNGFVDGPPEIVAEPSQYMSMDPGALDKPSNITASQQPGRELNSHYDKHFQTTAANRHQVEVNINHSDHRGCSNAAGTHGHILWPEMSHDDEFVTKGSLQALIFDDDSSMIDFDGAEQILERTPDKRPAMDNGSESIFNFTPRAEGHPKPSKNKGCRFVIPKDFGNHLTILNEIDPQAILFKRMKTVQVFDHRGKWTDPKQIVQDQVSQFDSIKRRWEGFFGRLEDLVQTKDAVLQHKRDLTKQYADAGEQLAEQCDEIQLATRHIHKKKRICRA